MSQRPDSVRVTDILECIKLIEEYIEGIDFESFKHDKKTQDAVIRNLEIIGEAAKSLSDGFKSMHHSISWREIGRMRDKLIHHYSGVNIDIVWVIIEAEIPKLRDELSKK